MEEKITAKLVEDRPNQRSVKRTHRSSTRLLVPWALSAFLALTLFTTFTYQPPDLPNGHPHISINDFTETSGSSVHRPAPPEPSSSNAARPPPPSDNAFGQIDLASLHLPLNATSVYLHQIPAHHPMQQNPILAALREAAVEQIPLDSWKQLPQMAEQLQDLYGPRTVSSTNTPLVLGMETCAAYREAVPLAERYVGPAGMFNTGTNALEHHLRTNILKVGSVWQIPWGKHRMPYQRLKHVAPGMNDKDQSKCLPVVIVRDPYHWMQSMCKSPYSAHWKHGPKRCPNLAMDEQDLRKFKDPGWGVQDATSFRVKVIFNKDNDIEYFDSLIHLWTQWYGLYYYATYPRLIIRFEDMLLKAPEVLAKIAECVGGEVRDPIQYQRGSAKAHGSHTDFLKAILKSADAEKRGHMLEQRDKDYALAHLEKRLMDAFEYKLTV